MSGNSLDYKKMGELAHTAVRDAIISGHLEPGSRLNQDKLAKQFGVSRAPIRDALNRLESEGLVQTTSGKGLVVAITTPEDLVNIFEFRAILDSHSHRLACERINQADLDRLQEIVDRTEKLTPDGDIHELVRAHAEFHYVIYAACGNPELERVARSLWDRSYRYRVMALSNKDIALLTLDEHKEILAALKGRDAQRVGELLVTHNRYSILRLRPDTSAKDPTSEAAAEPTIAPEP
jgi:DNA-binding GntR family transcriptional regulator